MRSTHALVIVLAIIVAGCTGGDEPSSATKSPTSIGTPSPGGNPFGSTPAPGGTPVASSPSVGGATTTPTAPPADARPLFTQSWVKEMLAGGETLTVSVPNGYRPTPFLIGFQPAFGAAHYYCEGPNATISVFAPDGARVAYARAGDLPLEGAGCPRAIRVPEVGITEGDWRIVFEGTGDIAAFVQSGERAGATNVTFQHAATHDFLRAGNTTLFVVPDHAAAVDVILTLGAANPGSTCTANEVRMVVRDPTDRQFERLEIAANSADCGRTEATRDVILAPGTWTVDWRGDGTVIGSIEIRPAS